MTALTRRSGTKFVCEVAPDTRLIQFNNLVVAVSPHSLPMLVTASGCETIEIGPPKAEGWSP